MNENIAAGDLNFTKIISTILNNVNIMKGGILLYFFRVFHETLDNYI